MKLAAWIVRFMFLPLALGAGGAHAVGACSPYIGQVTLNEYAHQLNFAEIKRLNVNTDIANWKVRIYRSSSPVDYAERSLPATADPSCTPPYIYQTTIFGSNETPYDADIVLLDANNDVVDILQARRNLPPISFYTPVPSCGYISPPIYVQVDPSRKGVDRMPDGTGPWRNTPGTGSGSYTTECRGNTPSGPAADLALTKTASPATLTPGGQVTFTVTLRNNGPNAANTVVVSDQLPAGLNYASHSVTAGTYIAATGIWSIATLGNGASATLTLVANAATVGTFTNVAQASSDNTDANTANNIASASVTVTSPVGAFNAVDVGADPATGKIGTKVAGSGFSLDIVALSSATPPALQTGFSGQVQVALLGNTAIGTLRDANNCPVTSSVLQTISPVTLPSGKATIAFAAQGNAWREVVVRISYAGPPAITRCSGDNFAMRPASLSAGVSDCDWLTAYTAGCATAARPLDNIAVPGGMLHKAGRPFSIAATALNALGVTTTNYTTNYIPNPTTAITACILPASGCSQADLNAGTWSGASGGILTTNATYAEVGAFNLQLQDQDFASVDSGDGTPADCGGRFVCSASAGVGRFVPDNFSVSYNTPVFGTACAAGNFTYAGQRFSYATAPAMTVLAVNAAGSPTHKYSGALWRITSASLTGKTYTAASGSLDISGIAMPDPVIEDLGLTVPLQAGTGLLTFNSGTGLFFTRGNPVIPFDAEISLGINILDEDGVAYAGNPARFGAATAGNGISFNNGKQMRYGVLQLANTHGSELLDLPMRWPQTLYAASVTAGVPVWALNDKDSCTLLNPANVALVKTPVGCTTAIKESNIVFAAGRGGMTFSKPLAACYVDATVNLGAEGKAYLQGKWGGAAYNQNPSARITFGTYKSGPIIYMRENF